jgi:hypothetical protein
MRCEQFAELVWDLVRPSVLPEELAAQARLHAADCAACARLLAEAELLQFGLKTLAQQVRSRPLPEGVERRLRAEVRRRWRRRALRRWLPEAAFAVAASGVLVLMLGPAGDRGVRDRGRQVAAALPAPVEQGLAVPKNPAKTGVTKPSPSRPEAQAFVLLPLADGLRPADSPLIVRVRLHPDALARLGYPTPAKHSGELVQADLIVGPDGWPYAVRVVH